MIRARRRWGAWLAAMIALSAAAAWGAAPAHAVAGRSTKPTSQIGSGRPLIAHNQAVYDQALKSNDWVQTPEGLAYKTCVYSVPNGASVANGYIVSPSGTRQQITSCTHPTIANPNMSVNTSRLGRTLAAPAISGACASDNVQYWAYSCWPSPRPLTYLFQEYAVPAYPQKNGALIYLWGGLQSTSGAVVQNVLTWGANTRYNTVPNNIWYITPWYVWSSPDGIMHSAHGTNVHVNPNDTIDSYLSAYNCDAAGDCTWLLQVSDANTGGVSSYTIGAGQPFTLLNSGVMEVPWAAGCVETPASGHAAFRDLQAEDNLGNIVNPTPFAIGYVNPQCSVHETSTATAADITWSP